MCIASIAKTEPMPLSTYTDAKGYLDVQAFTCSQLANTYQEDADMLAAWYSGWYNGLAKKHFCTRRAREVRRAQGDCLLQDSS